MNSYAEPFDALFAEALRAADRAYHEADAVAREQTGHSMAGLMCGRITEKVLGGTMADASFVAHSIDRAENPIEAATRFCVGVQSMVFLAEQEATAPAQASAEALPHAEEGNA